MSATTGALTGSRRAGDRATDGSDRVTTQRDHWPFTGRVMPWLIAVFLVMLFLLPFEAINLPLNLPINSQLDRPLLGVIFLVWVAVGLASTSVRWRRSGINVALYLFTVLCLVSIVVNLRDLAWDGELGLSVKQTALSLTYAMFFVMAATSLQREDVLALFKLAICLAVISAIGTIYEYREHTNLFYTIAHDIFSPFHISVNSAPVQVQPGQRASVVGPTGEGLADATMLGTAVPFAVALMARARRGRDQVLWGLAAVLILAGCVATQRKTALIVPIAAVFVMVCHEPRRYARYWPLLVVAVGVIVVAAPHSVSGLIYQFLVAKKTHSTTERTGDYSAVWPFIASHLLFGRGFGSFDPQKYRILDDTMLGLLVQVGVLGTVAYALLIGSVAWIANRCALRSTGVSRGVMSAACGAAVGFFLSNFLYDASSFRQGPYTFYFIAAAVVVFAASPSRSASTSAPSG